MNEEMKKCAYCEEVFDLKEIQKGRDRVYRIELNGVECLVCSKCQKVMDEL